MATLKKENTSSADGTLGLLSHKAPQRHPGPSFELPYCTSMHVLNFPPGDRCQSFWFGISLPELGLEIRNRGTAFSSPGVCALHIFSMQSGPRSGRSGHPNPAETSRISQPSSAGARRERMQTTRGMQFGKCILNSSVPGMHGDPELVCHDVVGPDDPAAMCRAREFTVLATIQSAQSAMDDQQPGSPGSIHFSDASDHDRDGGNGSGGGSGGGRAPPSLDGDTEGFSRGGEGRPLSALQASVI